MIECDHCSSKFHNRKNLRNHLRSFHELSIRGSRHHVSSIREGKPQRKIRMVMHMARLKREEEVTNRVRIGLTREGHPLPLLLNSRPARIIKSKRMQNFKPNRRDVRGIRA